VDPSAEDDLLTNLLRLQLSNIHPLDVLGLSGVIVDWEDTISRTLLRGLLLGSSLLHILLPLLLCLHTSLDLLSLSFALRLPLMFAQLVLAHGFAVPIEREILRRGVLTIRAGAELTP
jgi:hypothetical protein